MYTDTLIRPGARPARLAVVALLLALGCPRAFGLAFTPTDLEWAGWPEYCKARYTVSGAGHDSRFATMVADATVTSWQGKLADVWYGLHHYCAGLVVFERADDHFSEPEGGAGARIACGSIVSQGQ